MGDAKKGDKRKEREDTKQFEPEGNGTRKTCVRKIKRRGKEKTQREQSEKKRRRTDEETCEDEDQKPEEISKKFFSKKRKKKRKIKVRQKEVFEKESNKNFLHS